MKFRYILFTLSFLFWNCDSFTDIDFPENQLTGETVFQDVQTADAALAHIYSSLFNSVLVTGSQEGLGVLLGAYTDELAYLRTDGVVAGAFYLNQLTPLDNTVISIWNKSYNLIYDINSIIHGVESSSRLSEAEKSRLLGEALFCRAYIHYFLYGLFSDIPYVTSTNYQINTKIKKLDWTAFSAQLEQDLQLANTHLENTSVPPLKIRPTVDAVKVLKARINLLNKDWQGAIDATTSILNNPIYYLESDLDKVFLKESPETIWQLMPSKSGDNALEANSYVFTQLPPPTFSLSNILFDSFETNDLRKTHWIESLSNEIETYSYSYKYKQNQLTTTSIEYSIQFRLAEVYLMRAEAYIELGQIDNGVSDINVICNRAGLVNRDTNDPVEAMDYLIEERRHELFCEHGHRFFDLKRWGKLDETLKISKPNWQSYLLNLPLPEKELLLNPNLKPQNDGY